MRAWAALVVPQRGNALSIWGALSSRREGPGAGDERGLAEGHRAPEQNLNRLQKTSQRTLNPTLPTGSIPLIDVPIYLSIAPTSIHDSVLHHSARCCAPAPRKARTPISG